MRGKRAAKPAWAGDTDFEDVTISTVSAEASGWSITRSDGWSFGIAKDSPVEPKVGMAIRFYGQGIGYRVRGILLDGQTVFYRTAAQDKQDDLEQRYGKDSADLLARWDAGQGVWSVEMGGIGPGYEQAIQVAAFEMLRRFVVVGADAELWADTDVWTAVRADISDHVTPIVEPLGLSGAQWGAALSLAAAFYRQGPIAALTGAPKDRTLQVSKSFPSLDPAKATTQSEVG